jgi:hypothetical protein
MKRTTKRWIDETIRDWEYDEKVGLRLARRLSRVFPASKVAGALSRRDPFDDERIFQALIVSARLGFAVVMGRGRRPPVIKVETVYVETDEGEKDDKGRLIDVIWTPDWTHTGSRLKLLAFANVIAGESASAMTVKLGEDVVASALRSPRGFSGYITERMLRHLRQAGSIEPRYAFIVEGSPLHDFHLHGVISSSLSNPTLRAALAAVGGSTTLRATERQVDLRPITDLQGWVEYISKAPLLTTKALANERRKRGAEKRNGGLIGASRSVRAEGAVWYRSARATGCPIS